MIDNTHLVTCPSYHAVNRIPASKQGAIGKCGSCHAPLPPLYLEPIHLTDQSFESFVSSYRGPILAEFWAPW